MKTVTFYHSMICPRCHMAGRSLDALLAEFPEVVLERVEYLTHLGEAHSAGVRTIPALVAGRQRLSGFYLTRGAIRRFLEAL
jgi:predicted DsbA family dithiol-disulfide isomerase